MNELFEKELIEEDISPPPPARAPSVKAKGVAIDDGFEAFYAAYPRKVSKGSARKAWAKAAKLAEPAVIIAAAERYAAERRTEDPRFTKHPASWLNAEAWQDEPAPGQPFPSPTTGTGRSTAQERTAAALQHMRERSTSRGGSNIASIVSAAVRKLEVLK